MNSASPSLAALARPYEVNRKRAPRSIADLPNFTPQAEALAKELKAQGFRFVGPTSVYAFMQNVGVVNDHIHRCFRATDYRLGSSDCLHGRVMARSPIPPMNTARTENRCVRRADGPHGRR